MSATSSAAARRKSCCCSSASPTARPSARRSPSRPRTAARRPPTRISWGNSARSFPRTKNPGEGAYIERKQIGKLSAEIEEIGFDLKAGRIPAENAAARKAELEKQFATLKTEADGLNDGMAATNIIYKIADGRERPLPSGELLSAYTPNTTGFFGRLGEALRRAWHFLKEEPRNANAEGGVFPAIFGTVVMTLVMSLFVTPFGVIAAIYLREYAKQGLMVASFASA